MKKILPIIIFVFILVFALVPKTSNAETPMYIELDKTYLQKPVVSNNPIELKATIYNQQRQYMFGESASFKIISGSEFAEIKDDNMLYIKGVGTFTIESKVDGYDVKEEYTISSYNAKFSNIVILNKFENVSLYTQPIKLQSAIDVSLTDKDGKRAQSNNEHFLTTFSVVKGNAEIFEGVYLRITGVGEVVIEAKSIYDDDVKVTKSFNVVDSEEGIIVDGTKDYYQNHIVESEGCKSISSISLIALTLISLSGCIIIKKKKEN